MWEGPTLPGVPTAYTPKRHWLIVIAHPRVLESQPYGGLYIPMTCAPKVPSKLGQKVEIWTLRGHRVGTVRRIAGLQVSLSILGPALIAWKRALSSPCGGRDNLCIWLPVGQEAKLQSLPQSGSLPYCLCRWGWDQRALGAVVPGTFYWGIPIWFCEVAFVLIARSSVSGFLFTITLPGRRAF